MRGTKTATWTLQEYDEHYTQVEAELDTANKENKRLQEELKTKKGAAGILQQIVDRLKALTGEQNVWKAIDILSKQAKEVS